mmetsp:Transcript_3887/g.2879  ORF Transcript_3887/g.2879 Transcript_3887/m.2879 type:complete len:232 (-) Transcript_3887:377-1072(-)|eukprot:CAMPEP_0202967676 /NCGR_PEP_ID=MMETSP1396-20130829/12659_1 /ASSEMBLY_ACC=CAM_ASM_000872 /TAXON_ID= /ORGANISM="Pseudokeronopsis sp., Strain Brazil" /LENGTH=231 /DNA_ID=CAMNT_0049693037 /DNA_START=455 /DNA_END=1150 /DNA_ORIENTATION=+
MDLLKPVVSRRSATPNSSISQKAFMQLLFSKNKFSYFDFDHDSSQESLSKSRATPNFGEDSHRRREVNFKFIFKNEKERLKFLANLESALVASRKLEFFGNGGQGGDAEANEEDYHKVKRRLIQCRRLNSFTVKKKTLVITDLHGMLVFIRDRKESSQDILISSKNSPGKKTSGQRDFSVKFYISLRNGLIKFLEAISAHFNLVLYVSTSKQIGSLIVEYLESRVGKGPLF